VKAAKQSMVGGQLGGAWAKLIEDKGIFLDAWEACRKGIREAPHKNSDRSRGWICIQIQDRNPILHERPNDRGDNFVKLGALMPGLSKAAHDVRFLQHRPLPEGAKITELKVIRRRTHWWVVLTIDNEIPKNYPATGLSFGGGVAVGSLGAGGCHIGQ
jgi:hypothetical protein